MRFSKKILSMQKSPIRRFNLLAQEAESRGKKIYRLNIGQPDITTPLCFMDAIKDFDKKIIAYGESEGMALLQNAIVDYFKYYEMTFAPQDIMITNGGSEALSMVFTTILDPGDEVIIAEPYYTNYSTFVKQADGFIVPVTTKAEEGYSYADRDKIETAITPKTKAICCISPGNPTGNILSIEDMTLIGRIAEEHDLWIISDEVYREFAYDGRKVTSFGMLDELKERVVIVDSISKRFSACGARIGYIISRNKQFISNAIKLAQGRLCAPTIEQVGAAALYKMPHSYFETVRSEYEGRRDIAYEELMKIPGVVCMKPGGAFYMTAKLPVKDVEDFLIFLLEDFDDKGETVMFAPAEGFYATPGLGKDEMRIAYVLNKDDMKRGVELIRLGIEAYNKK